MLLSSISGYLWYFYYTIERLFIQGKEHILIEKYLPHLCTYLLFKTQQISTPPSIFLIAFGWSTDNPCVFRKTKMHCYQTGQVCTAAEQYLQVRQLTSAYPYVRRQCRYYRLSDSSALFQSSEQRIYHILRSIRRKNDLYSVFTNNDVFL